MSSLPARIRISSNSGTRGALVDETYSIFAAWDPSVSQRENLARVRKGTVITCSSYSRLADITDAFGCHYEPGGRDRALFQLVRRGLPMHEFKPILLWHMARSDLLVQDFIENWLYPNVAERHRNVCVRDVETYLESLQDRFGEKKKPWSISTTNRTAAGLVKLAADFGLLRGKVHKQRVIFDMPEQSFLYILHAIHDDVQSTLRTVKSSNWRLFLMDSVEIEHRILRLHQFRKLDYQVAGSIAQLALPCASACEYAERMVI